MAEAMVNAQLGEKWEAFSAGIKPAGYVHPKTLEVLAEIGIQHTGQSKPVEKFRDMTFDLVVTVCDEAAEECPIWLGKGKRIHYNLPDPAKSDNINDFRLIRDEIKSKVIVMLKQMSNKNEN